MRHSVYCIVEADSPNGPCKVGIARYLYKRLSSLQGGNHRELKLAWYRDVSSRDVALDLEGYMLRRLQSKRLKSEWLDASPGEAETFFDVLYSAYLSDGGEP